MLDRFVDADAWKGLKEKVFGKEFQLGVKEVTQQAIIGETSYDGGAPAKYSVSGWRLEASHAH